MHDDMRSFVENLPVFDVHEHHMPDILGNRDVGLLELLWQSYGGWTQARPYPLASETGFDDASYGDVGRIAVHGTDPWQMGKTCFRVHQTVVKLAVQFEG